MIYFPAACAPVRHCIKRRMAMLGIKLALASCSKGMPVMGEVLLLASQAAMAERS